jgi:hypothetical protein
MKYSFLLVDIYSIYFHFKFNAPFLYYITIKINIKLLIINNNQN